MLFFNEKKIFLNKIKTCGLISKFEKIHIPWD
jgi:hypothetical protein